MPIMWRTKLVGMADAAAASRWTRGSGVRGARSSSGAPQRSVSREARAVPAPLDDRPGGRLAWRHLAYLEYQNRAVVCNDRAA